MKKTPKSWVGTWLTPSLLLGAIVAGGFLGGKFLQKDEDYKENVKTVQFDDASQKAKTIEHINSDYTPVKQYQNQQRLDSIYVFAMEQFQEKQYNDSIIHAEEHYKDSIKKLKEKKVEKSRAGRDSVNVLILQQLRKLNDTL